ncbi:MAG: hypothetical protein USCAAHI_01331 [Beijerinckiaceae bacterium]|nr:MAG: hypothetical protein USCAAHI_01331 [Beijerinckiaceae bacterium]
MTLGFDKQLYILPFDHRGTFQTTMFDWEGTLTAAQTAEIAAAKQAIYDGFKATIAAGVLKDKAGILVEEQFGAAILHDAAAQGYATACPAEKSGQEEFDFEYGEDFAEHVEAFRPTFCRVVVRYNPEGDQALNRRQSARLKRLSEYMHGKSRSRFAFELLVLPEKAQLERVMGDKKTYDLEFRPRLMVQAIQQMQDAGSIRTFGRSRGSTAAKTARRSWPPRAGTAATKSAASSWVGARTTCPPEDRPDQARMRPGGGRRHRCNDCSAGSCCRRQRSRGRIGDFWRQRSGIRRHTRLQAAVR